MMHIHSLIFRSLVRVAIIVGSGEPLPAGVEQQLLQPRPTMVELFLAANFIERRYLVRRGVLPDYLEYVGVEGAPRDSLGFSMLNDDEDPLLDTTVLEFVFRMRNSENIPHNSMAVLLDRAGRRHGIETMR